MVIYCTTRRAAETHGPRAQILSTWEMVLLCGLGGVFLLNIVVNIVPHATVNVREVKRTVSLLW